MLDCIFLVCVDARGCVWMCVVKEGGRGRAHATRLSPARYPARTMWVGVRGCGWIALKNAPKLCKGWAGAWI